MNYLKINFLHLFKFVIIGILFFAIVYLKNHLTELYKTELNKNFLFEKKFTVKNHDEKLELEKKARNKKDDFSNYLNYFFLTTIFGIVIISFVNGKIDSENNKLNEFEKET